MKHNRNITLIILGMFLIAQFIGLYVIASGLIPGFIDPSQDMQEVGYGYYFIQLVFSFLFAFLIFALITKYKLNLFFKSWFFLVVVLALTVSLNAILSRNFGIPLYVSIILAVALGLAKLWRPSVIIHNGTELLIYPGIATIFVASLNIFYTILLLILISIYDMWAVWKSGIMQKMAKYQMNELKILGGFLIPYLTKEIRQKIKNLKGKKVGIKIPVAILGGGDIVFPIITAGVFMNQYGLAPALAVIFGAFAGLTYLLLLSKKNKFYPAMPFITTGIFLGLLVWLLSRLW